MKLERFDVIFDEGDDPESPVYFAGEEMRGRIILTFKEETKINEILLEFKGGARTYWTKHSGKSRRHFRQSEPYFCEQFNTRYTHAYGKSHERVLPSGTHEIPFAFKLSKSLPSSFEGEYGFVRYTCKALLERPWDHDIICKRAFSVVGLEDLNVDEKAAVPIALTETDFNVQHCFRRVGSIGLGLALPKTGYAPGECLVIDVSVKNDSRRTITKPRLHFKQRTRYMAKDFHNKVHEKVSCRTLATRQMDRNPIAPGVSDQWQCSDLVVDAIAPKLIRCTIIDINYSVDLEVDPGIVLSVPILVGTIPIAPIKPAEESKIVVESGALDPSKMEAAPNGKLNEKGSPSPKTRVRVTSSVPKKMYPTLPFPTFEKCHFSEVDIQDDKENVQYGQRKFIPKYPCYRTLVA